MFRLTAILIAIALPFVGISQICIEDSDEFVYESLTLSSLQNCSPTVLYENLSVCELAHISVDLSNVGASNPSPFDPDKLVIDIRQPGVPCFLRFVSNGIVGSGLLDMCPSYCEPFYPIAWNSSQSYTFNIDASIFSSINPSLSGIWVVALSYLDENIDINSIKLDFVGSCCGGCTDSSACNYDSEATYDDGTCLQFDMCGVCGGDGTNCSGCTDSTACNWDLGAMVDDGSCVYPNPNYYCDGTCINDYDGDGTCDEYEIPGCTDPTASNYNPLATDDNGTCQPPVVNGCTDPAACNYDPNATYDDGSCNQHDQCGVCGGDDSTCAGCTYDTACNFDPLAILDDASCIFGDVHISLEIQTDYYPGETTWVINDPFGIVLASGGPYNSPETLYVEDICLPSGCYIFSINDSYGDGICCTYGLGSYTLISNGNILMSGGEFGQSETFQVCFASEGCTYPNACNYDIYALEDDGTCIYPADLDACDCVGNQPDALGVCGGNCFTDYDGDGICDTVDECVGIVDLCGVCNGPGAIYECGCNSLPEGVCDCNGTPCSASTTLLEISNPFLELSYVQNAAPFISVYDGWFDADFVTIGICRPQAILEPTSPPSQFKISFVFEDSPGFVDFFVDAPEFQQELTIQFPQNPTASITASQIVSIRLQDDSGITLDSLSQDGTPWPNVTLNGIYYAPGQHRVVRQPWILQGNSEIDETEWLICDENESLSFYSSWNLESITQVPLDPSSLQEACLNDLDGDGICDQLELPVYCQNVNSTNYSPLQNTIICDEAEIVEYWISSFNLPEIAQQGGLLPPLPPGQQPEASAMVASDLCDASASQLAFCNFGQRAFVVNENVQSVQIIDYGDLSNPSPIDNGAGGFLSILADDMETQLNTAGVSDITTLVPSDVDIFNVVGPDDTTYCCSTMVAVAWLDTNDLSNSGWVTLHDVDGALLHPDSAIREVGPTPRSLAFSQNGNWLVVACSGEGEHEGIDDPMAQIVCIDVAAYTQATGTPDWTEVVDYPIRFVDGSHIEDFSLNIEGGASRTSASSYEGPDTHLSYMLEPSHVAISPRSDRAFVNCQVNNTLVEVDLDAVPSNINVIKGAYGYGRRDMSSGSGFDGKSDGFALLEAPSPGTIEGWYQPGDMVIDTTDNPNKLYLLTANEGLPSKDASGVEDVDQISSGPYSGLEIDQDYPTDSYVFGSRSFTIWDISTPGSPPSVIYDSESLIEETLAELMPDYANSLKSTYDSFDQASVSRGPEPSGIAFGTLNEKKIIIVSLEEMGGSMIFNLFDYDNPTSVSASYQAYATNRDFQNNTVDNCVVNHLGAKDVVYLHSTITDNTSVTGVHEGYDAVLVSNDETGSLTLFRLDSNLKIPGCTDSCACNYNENATLNDGSCDDTSCAGCIYPDADNYVPTATLDDGTCTFTFTNDCPADLNGDESVTTGDLLIFLGAYGTICPP